MYACNHGQYEAPCPGGCHNEVARLGADAGPVLQFEREANSRAARRLCEVAGTNWEELAKLGPDVVELVRYNLDPWPWMRGAAA